MQMFDKLYSGYGFQGNLAARAYVVRLCETLEHWKTARESGKFSDQEIAENKRCATDLCAILADTTTIDKKAIYEYAK